MSQNLQSCNGYTNQFLFLSGVRWTLNTDTDRGLTGESIQEPKMIKIGVSMRSLGPREPLFKKRQVFYSFCSSWCWRYSSSPLCDQRDQPPTLTANTKHPATSCWTDARKRRFNWCSHLTCTVGRLQQGLNLGWNPVWQRCEATNRDQYTGTFQTATGKVTEVHNHIYEMIIICNLDLDIWSA